MYTLCLLYHIARMCAIISCKLFVTFGVITVYTETLEPAGRPVMVYIASVACAAGIYAVSRLMVTLGIPYSAVFLFAGAAVLAYWLLRRHLTSYRYTLDNGCFYVERLVGKRVQTLAGVELSLAKRFCPYDKPSLPKAALFPVTNRSLRSGAYALDFCVEGNEKLNRLLLHPSDELAALINSGIEEAANERRETEPEIKFT